MGRMTMRMARITTNSHDDKDQYQPIIRILDGVFDEDACMELHYLAEEHSERTEGSSVFSWNPSEDENDEDDAVVLTPIEHALKSVLQALYPKDAKLDNNDQTKDWMVEYWSRSEYMNIDTHADIDERYLLDDADIRCPHYGHVLYLQVDPTVRGPTCVFPQRLGGWQDDGHDNNSNVAEHTTTSTLVTVVPAVSGRVLQFPGSAMHAVPKPATLWFQTLEEQQQQVTLEEEEEEEEEEDDDTIERSVILFNVWFDQGPRGVTEDYMAKGEMPDGVQLVKDEEEDQDANSGDEDKDRGQRAKAHQMEAWEEDFGTDCRDVWCQPREEWLEVPIIATTTNDSHNANKEHDDTTEQNVLIPLMGKQARRLFPTKHVQLSAPGGLYQALQEASQPRQFVLVQQNNNNGKP